ncbi:MAG: DNA polymerase III subunit delta, partial [bacterium]
FIFEAEKVDFRKNFYKALKKPEHLETRVFVQDFKMPYDNQMPGWIQIRARNKYNKHISIQAAALLVERVGPSSLSLDAELNKLSTFTKSPEITISQVEEITHQRHFDIFKYIALIAERQTIRSVLHIPDLLSADPGGNQFINLLHRHFVILLKIKLMQSQGKNQQQIAKALNLNPWFLQNKLRYCQQAQGFSAGTIAEILINISELELDLRHSGINRSDSLEKWLLTLNRL